MKYKIIFFKIWILSLFVFFSLFIEQKVIYNLFFTTLYVFINILVIGISYKITNNILSKTEKIIDIIILFLFFIYCFIMSLNNHIIGIKLQAGLPFFYVAIILLYLLVNKIKNI